MKKEIKALVEAALSDHPRHQALEIGTLPRVQAAMLQKYVTEDMTGAVRIIDTSGIRHALKEHGSAQREALHGQLPVNIDDFVLVPEILKSPDDIRYAGKNKLKHDVFIYEKRIGAVYYVAEAVRFSKKKGDKLVFQTMYKKK